MNLRRKNRKAYEEAQLDYLIVQERIPSGFRLLPNTLTGNFFDHDLRDNMITLYYGSRWNLGDLSYSLVAVTPGEYRLPPTLVRSVYQPERFHVNNSDRQLTVLPRTEQSPDEYRLSPDQRYHLGRLHFDDGKFAAAAEHLTSLTAGDWVIRDDYYKKTVRMLAALRFSSGTLAITEAGSKRRAMHPRRRPPSCLTLSRMIPRRRPMRAPITAAHRPAR